MTRYFNPALDLRLQREVDVTPAELWHAWTTPAHLKQWFCPRPWLTVECEIDLVPGGRFHTVMQSPEGQRFANSGCYLEIVPDRALTWTNALEAGFRPIQHKDTLPGQASAELLMTASILLQPSAHGTLYTATALHADAEARQRHAEMGFEQGWGIVLDQLVAEIKRLRR